MLRSIRIPLLAMGVVLGYGSAFHSMHHQGDHRDAWERHISDVCVRAADRVKQSVDKADKAESPKTESPKTESPEP